MKITTASTEINAKPETIWGILTDAAKYIQWDPGIIKLEGTISLGGKLTIYAKVSPNRAFKITVTELTTNRKMVWSSGMPLGLFKGERSFTLEPQSNGSVKFKVEEVFSGLLLPLIGGSIPDLTSTFEEFAAALKARAEQS